MRSRVRALLLVVGVSLALLGGGAGTALAHGGATPGVLSVAQTLGLRELTVALFRPPSGSGEMAVAIAAQQPDPGAPVRVRVVPAGGGGTDDVTSEAMVPTTATTGTDRPALRIERPGAWEVLLGEGPGTARIPLLVPAPVTPGWVWMVRGGLLVGVVALIGALAVRRNRPRTGLTLGAASLVGVAVAATAALLSTSIPAPGTEPTTAAHGSGSDAGAAGSAGGAAMGGMSGMDMGGMSGMDMSGSSDGSAMSGHGSGAVVLGAAATPQDGGPVDLALGLADGSTGAPVDDLVVHDDALIHLAVIGPGNRLWHVHPVRTAPGRYSVALPLTEPGGYGVFAEMERADGGHQVTRSAFALAAPRPASAPAALVSPPSPLSPPTSRGAVEVGGMQVATSVTTPVAGRGSRVQVAFSRGGQPVRNLQGWLGMAGHLMVLGPASTTPEPDPTDPAVSFAHVHDMSAPTPSGYGPVVGFSYVFPAPGRYQLWAQVQHDRQLITVPMTVDVAAATTPAGV